MLELNPDQPRISGVHVVKAMDYDKYYIPGMRLWEMFHKIFWPENDNYIQLETLNGYDAIDIIKINGGIPVIAHPKSIKNDRIVLDLINYGAQGIEVYHPIHNNEDNVKYLQIAKDKKLFITGGTDWHGKNNGSEVTQFAMTGLEHQNYEILNYKKINNK